MGLFDAYASLISSQTFLYGLKLLPQTQFSVDEQSSCSRPRAEKTCPSNLRENLRENCVYKTLQCSQNFVHRNHDWG